MEQSQAELAAMQFVGKICSRPCPRTLTGDKKVISIDFNPAVVDPEDLETLSDMTVQAINSALEQIDETTKKNWVLSLGNCHSKHKKNKHSREYLPIMGGTTVLFYDQKSRNSIACLKAIQYTRVFLEQW